MSFLNAVKEFNVENLRPTEVQVTSLDGRRFVEKKSQSGEGYDVKSTLSTGCGYVLDLKPDLQVGHILPYLLLGSGDVARDQDLLKSLSVTHIFNCATGIPNFFPETFLYLTLEILDLPETNILQYFQKFFDYVESARSGGGKVLVHCNAGVSRSATFVIAYLMKELNLDFETAHKKVKDKRPAIRPNDGFKQQLLDYDRRLQH